jgi:hypothetical protein
MKRPDVRIQTQLTAKDSMQLDYSGRPDTVAMISDLCNNADRTQDIADMAIKVLKDPQRCVLVLSERRKHLEDIYKLLEPDPWSRDGLCGRYEGVRREDVERNARVIMASVSAAAEGFDVPRLNCIILASPRATWSRAWANHENPCWRRASIPTDHRSLRSVVPRCSKETRSVQETWISDRKTA